MSHRPSPSPSSAARRRGSLRLLHLLTWIAALGFVAAGCGGSSDPAAPAPPGGGTGGGTGGGNTFTATIDGTAWTSDANVITVTGSSSPTHAGTMIISGYETSSGTTLSLTLSFIGGPSTEPLGVNTDSTPGGIGMVIKAPASWTTPYSGDAGTITVTTRTATHIAGTFQFTAANTLNAADTKAVTGGSFDITIDGGLPGLPTSAGSTAVATIGGAAWDAATVVASNAGSGIFTLAANNTAYSVTLVPTVPVTASGDYGVPSQMSLTVMRTGTADSWAATTGADIGTVHVATFDAHHLVISFSADLPPLNTSGALSIDSGQVDAYLP